MQTQSIEKYFKIKERGSDVSTEIVAGITTFMTMAYILAVNPGILQAAGMDFGGVFMATCIASAVACVAMAIFANYPFALAPGMGLNAYFAYSVVLGMGYSWQMALTAVLVEGLVFIVLSVTNIREAIFNSIPMNLKYAVSAGIGLFIAFIGLQNAGIVVDNPSTLLGLISFKGVAASGGMNTTGICALLAMIGVIIIGIFMYIEMKGAILVGILVTWVLGILCQFMGLYAPDGEAYLSLLPNFRNYAIPSIAPVFMQFDLSKVLSFDFIAVVFAFLFVDIFDTLGGLIGVASRGDLLDKDGKLPGIKGALLADAVGTTAGAILGTSTVTTYVESATGVSQGGRTGLTAIVTGFFFILSIFLYPIFMAIPSFATAPALIVVGFVMMGTVTKIDLENVEKGLPAFVTMLSMPIFYSISEGISLGIISYAAMDLAGRIMGKKGKEEKINYLMYFLAVFMILKYIFV